MSDRDQQQGVSFPFFVQLKNTLAWYLKWRYFVSTHTCPLMMFRSFTRKKLFWSTRSPFYFFPKQYLVLSLNFRGKWLTQSISLCSGVNHNLLKLGNSTNTTCKNGKTSSLKSNMQTLKRKLPRSQRKSSVWLPAPAGSLQQTEKFSN